MAPMKLQPSPATGAIRVCLVTQACAGVWAGKEACHHLALFMAGLAALLVAQGHAVDLVITDPAMADAPLSPLAQAGGLGRILRLRDLAQADRVIEMPVDPVTRSYAIYRHLRRSDYAVVHFHDTDGLGFYAALAREQGLLACRLVTHALGTRHAARGLSLDRPSCESLKIEAIEYEQLRLSDAMTTTHRALLDPRLPADTAVFIGDLLFPEWFSPAPPPMAATPGAPPADRVRTLVYCGRQTYAQGFDLFIEAVARLPAELAPPLVFLSPFDKVFGEHSGAYLYRRLQHYRGRIDILGPFDAEAAQFFLAQDRAALAVFPTQTAHASGLMEELRAAGLPYLAPALEPGAAPRMTPAALAARLEAVLAGPPPAPVPPVQRDRVIAAWRDWHAGVLAAPAEAEAPPAPMPLVSVCLVHHERPALLIEALDALAAQDYPRFEVILVDDGSRSAAALDVLERLEAGSSYPFPLTLIRGENRYLGAARNTAARHARGEFLLFHDDDNLAEPHELSQFVRSALKSGADILTCQAYHFHGEPDRKPRILHYPLGLGGAFAFYENSFGDANALVRKTVFDRLGGFSEHEGLGWEDWEFFLKAFLAGAKIRVVPEPLFWYRISAGGMRATGNPALNAERLFAMVKTARTVLSEDFLRLALAGRGARAEKTRLCAIAETLPEPALHRNLHDLAPAGAEARRRLVPLIASLGRHAEALDMARRLGLPEDEVAALNGVASLQRGPATTLAFVMPEGAPAFLSMSGWWDGAEAAGFPDRFEIDGEPYRLLAVERIARADVTAARGLPPEAMPGFILLAEREENSSLLRRFFAFMRFFAFPRGFSTRPVEVGLGRAVDQARSVRFLAATGTGGFGHIDQLFRCRRIAEETGEEARLIDIGAAHDIRAVALQNDRLIVPTYHDGPAVARFRLAAGPAEIFIDAGAIAPRMMVY
jgi:GT2 family glycosyltransferase